MASTKSLIYAALILYTCVVEINPAEACGGFLKYCRAPFGHSGGELRASCRNNKGVYVAAKLNLNRYLSNVNGNLVPGTGYLETCQDFGYVRVGNSEFLVTANCKKFDGQLRSTSYNVNSRVSSNNGVMKWDTGTCRRRSLLEDSEGDEFMAKTRGADHVRKLLSNKEIVKISEFRKTEFPHRDLALVVDT